MTYDEAKERLAREMAPNVADRHLEVTWGFYMGAAEKALDMLKPKLVWEEIDGIGLWWQSGKYIIFGGQDEYVLSFFMGGRIDCFPTLKAAQAAAESHAFAEWIKGTALGAEDE